MEWDFCFCCGIKSGIENCRIHTQWGIEFVERYTKFVKERSEIETNYAKQIRNLSKKYTSCVAFLTTLNELNDYAGQHEVIAENLTSQIISELSRYLQELKTERKSHFHDGRKAQQHIESSWKQLESCKRKFERDCKEADRAQQYFEKMDADINVTKADVEKARQQAQMRHQMASDSKSDYSAYLQKFNQEQNEHYYTVIPNIFQVNITAPHRDTCYTELKKLSNYRKYSILIDRCPSILELLLQYSTKHYSIVVESYKSGFEPPGDVEFEDYGQAMKRTASETSLSNSKDGKERPGGKSKVSPPGSGPEDFSHLPPEQRRKKLQGKIDELSKDIQKEMDQRDALTKMKDVYAKNPQMGDPTSVDPRLTEIGQNIEKLQHEVQKFEVSFLPVFTLISECVSVGKNSETHVKANINPNPTSSTPEFDDEFDDEEALPTIGTCKALYPFEGSHNEGTISVAEGELLYVIEEDKGDGWTRVRRNEDEEGYVPTSYVEVLLETNAKGAMTYI
uniref:Formin binding protein 1 n=1 Tax=Myripristis murdjan TaxID=586833 RepID=A0A668A183_9TELE